jgi:hypothetical protein
MGEWMDEVRADEQGNDHSSVFVDGSRFVASFEDNLTFKTPRHIVHLILYHVYFLKDQFYEG